MIPKLRFLPVSIIIPTYNSKAFLKRAFTSAINQAPVVLEIVIVDNNSSDGTIELAERLCAEHPGYVVLAHESVQGAAAARNTGVRIARGEWIQFLDSDDELLPGKIERQVSLLEQDTDWVIGAYYQVDQTGEQVLSTVMERDPWKGLVHNGGVGNTNSNLIRREKFLAVGGQNEGLVNGEDNDLYFRLLKAGSKVVYDDVPGSVYHYRSGYRLSEVENKATRASPITLKQQVMEYLRREMPLYYESNGSFFRAALLNEIRRLATRNFKEAHAAIRLHFPNGVNPNELDPEITSALVKLYPIVGFRIVEKCRLFGAGLLPKRLKKSIRGK